MEQWYALHTKPHQEVRVAKRFEELGTETFIPRIWRTNRAGPCRSQAYFPCYLFARFDLAVFSAAQSQWTLGLRRVVAFGDTPAVIPTPIIELIRSKVNQLNQKRSHARERFNPGDPVQITQGPMADMVGIFEKDYPPAERVSVLLNFLGRVCRVQVDATNLERAAHRPHTVEPRPPRQTRGHGRHINRNRIRFDLPENVPDSE